MYRVLIVDDEPDIRNLIKDILEDEGFDAHTAASGEQAEKILASATPDIMLLDIWMPDMDGITLLRKLSIAGTPAYPIIVMSGHGTVETAVEATKLGAVNYIEKPLSTDKLLRSVRNALETRTTRKGELLRAKKPVENLFIGKSSAIESLRRHMAEYTNNDRHILLCGERGVGKELFAQNLHSSYTQPVPFTSIYADALYAQGAQHSLEEQFSSHNGGVIFLSDVAELSTEAQKSLTGHINDTTSTTAEHHGHATRLIAATSGKPAHLVNELYQCLRQHIIKIPPLRERHEDIPDLLEYYANLHSTYNNIPYRHFSVASQNLLLHYNWPGNLRELRELNFALLSSGNSGNIEPDEINPKLHSFNNSWQTDEFSRPLREARQQFEKRYIMHHLKLAQYNVSQAASRIGVERTYLYRKMRDLRIRGKD